MRGNQLHTTNGDTWKPSRTKRPGRLTYAQLDEMFDTAACGMSVITDDFNVVRINDTLATFLDMDKHVATGKKCYEVFSSALCHTERCPLVRSMAGEERTEYHDIEILCGEAPRVFVVVATPFRDSDGRRRGIVESLLDITERKRVEERLRESEQKFKDLVENTTDWVWEVDENGVYTYASPKVKELLGYEANEVLGKTPFDLMSEEEVQRVGKLFKEKVVKREPLSGLENTNRHKDGHLVILETNGIPIIDEQGGFKGYRGIDRDITQRKQAEQEKQRMEQQVLLSGRLAAVGELAAGVAHELNNPLAAVQGFAELAASRNDLDETLKSDLETIHREAKRASRITANLLSFSRQHNPQKSLISVNACIEKCLELHTYRMRVNNVESSTELGADLPLTMADFHQLQQVFVNLITNAEQAMTEAHGKGQLSIKTQKAGDTIKITFTDDGPGIPEQNLNKIFDPFFTTKDVGKGTGLGLSICYGIVEQHGGRIHASSTLGEGTSFAVEIPIVTADQDMAESKSIQSPAK